jgi:hypothetical protein
MSPERAYRKSRAFTLIEGLFSMLLVLLVLGALTKTLSDTGKIRANRSEMDRAVEELHALDLLRSDLVASLQLVQPAVGESGPVLELNRVDPELSFDDRIGPLGDAANPYEPSELVEVAYRVQDQALRRTVTPASGSPREERVQKCREMLVRRRGHGVVLALTFAYSRLEKTRTMRVELR